VLGPEVPVEVVEGPAAALKSFEDKPLVRPFAVVVDQQEVGWAKVKGKAKVVFSAPLRPGLKIDMDPLAFFQFFRHRTFEFHLDDLTGFDTPAGCDRHIFLFEYYLGICTK